MERRPHSNLYTLVVIPILIFLARILDVSMGTVRVVFITRGFRFLAPLIGFFEVLVWICVISQILNDLRSPIYYVAYAGGFAAGTFAGMYIEDKISLGKVIIRVITRKKSTRLLNALKGKGYVVTSINEESPDGEVDVVFTVIKRQDIHKTIEIIKKFSPKAFYSIEDVRFVSEIKRGKKRKRMFGFYRKAK